MAASRAMGHFRRPALGLAALLSACAPAPIFRYASPDPADRWEAGVRWHAADAGGLACSTSFAGDASVSMPGYGQGRTLTFGLILRNRARATVRIDPADFRLSSPRLESDFPAVDPESVLIDLDRRIAAATEARARADRDEAAADTGKAQGEAHRYGRMLIGLKEERRFWSEGHLRRTDLDSGRAMAGQLAFLFPVSPFPFPERPPPDTLILRWMPPGGKRYELGRFIRPHDT